jgi:hypothetical protein
MTNHYDASDHVRLTEYIMEFYQENHRATWLAMGEIYPQKAAFI